MDQLQWFTELILHSQYRQVLMRVENLVGLDDLIMCFGNHSCSNEVLHIHKSIFINFLADSLEIGFEIPAYLHVSVLEQELNEKLELVVVLHCKLAEEECFVEHITTFHFGFDVLW